MELPHPQPAPPSAADETVDEAMKLLGKVTGKFTDLLKTPGAGQKLVRLAKSNGVPIEVKEERVQPDMPKVGDSLLHRTVRWPAMEALTATFAALATELAMDDMGFDMGG